MSGGFQQRERGLMAIMKKRDIRRWAILTLRNNGASEAQFPLPVTHNGIRLLMGRDTPTIAPAFFAEASLKGTALVRFEETAAPRETTKGIRSVDEVSMSSLQYSADVLEIPAEYQTLEGIAEFERLLADPATAPSGYEDFVHTKIGVREMSPLSIQYDQELKAKAAAQAIGVEKLRADFAAAVPADVPGKKK
jgi:hypothetical protein